MDMFIDGLNPWLAKEIKLKQPIRIQEIMRMAEILEDSTSFEKCQCGDIGSKFTKTLQTKNHWKGKEAKGGASKPKLYEVKKLSRCRSGKAYVMIEEDDHDESSNHEFEQEKAKPSEEDEEIELSLNALSGVQKPTSIGVIA